MNLKHLKYTIATSDKELEQIIKLQQKNLTASISQSEKEKEGFVTVEHDLNILKKMNDQQPHVIAKDGDLVVGYTLCMTADFGNDIPVLRPMFRKIERSFDQNETYIVMGQVCIDKEYRGQGIFRSLYQKMKLELQEKYDLLITEVAANNLRSLQAHKAIGFKNLLVYKSDEIDWHLISWNWE
ncbi:GNAT family N-acetyltransferase [Aquimarina sp. BL5]|uniref:GNAT family N-acetyltransferase n=1 Tax=Aquimarina sp. BL5 TaxID=1714860 RepID=UPI000E5559DB|nr:GNAT family N-acetyltransferase [Aquimarina sp. BL5]AXT52233.1 GNAT family N-acetyltransferase [Aquimarina sp. BL5]RKN05641.1 GNAT family N-acetyltransferase [Aquimarina sp. BL5]